MGAKAYVQVYKCMMRYYHTMLMRDTTFAELNWSGTVGRLCSFRDISVCR